MTQEDQPRRSAAQVKLHMEWSAVQLVDEMIIVPFLNVQVQVILAILFKVEMKLRILKKVNTFPLRHQGAEIMGQDQTFDIINALQLQMDVKENEF